MCILSYSLCSPFTESKMNQHFFLQMLKIYFFQLWSVSQTTVPSTNLPLKTVQNLLKNVSHSNARHWRVSWLNSQNCVHLGAKLCRLMFLSFWHRLENWGIKARASFFQKMTLNFSCWLGKFCTREGKRWVKPVILCLKCLILWKLPKRCTTNCQKCLYARICERSHQKILAGLLFLIMREKFCNTHSVPSTGKVWRLITRLIIFSLSLNFLGETKIKGCNDPTNPASYCKDLQSKCSVNAISYCYTCNRNECNAASTDTFTVLSTLLMLIVTVYTNNAWIIKSYFLYVLP